MNYRLDVYANGKEIWGEEAEATHGGFEELLRMCPSLWNAVDDEIRCKGVATLSPEQIADEEFQQRLEDILSDDPSWIKEISFVMCLWHDEEHLKSCVSK